MSLFLFEFEMKQTKLYEFAEIKVKVKFSHVEVGEFFKKYESKGKPNFRISVQERDLAVERRLAEQYHNHFAEWQFEELAIHRLFSARAAKEGVLLFHSSAVMVDGEAYLFAAPSGTGKSTHTRLWHKVYGDKVTIINDDKPFLRVKEGKCMVYGSPWNGKHQLDNNIKAPVKAICFLEQSAENSIRCIQASEAFPLLCRQTYFSDKRRVSEAILNSLRCVMKCPMYLLKCNISEEAARMSYHALHGESIE